MSLIEINDLNKVFHKKETGDELHVLKNINLSIDEGEFVILLGPSGSGKSTLLRIIAGLEEATSGTVWFENTRVTTPSRERGMVFQAYTSFPWLSVYKNIEFGLKHSGVIKEKRRHTVQRLIELVGLHGFENSYPRELSGGMKQRLAIARSLAMSPKALLMDEPFGAVDAQTRQTLQEEILSIQKETRKTILFVTHDIDEALLLGSRIVVISSLPGMIISDEHRTSRRMLSHEYFYTDDFFTEKRKYARLLENRHFKVALSEWEGHAPTYYAREEGFIPSSINITFGISGTQRKEGLIHGAYDALGITLNSILEILPHKKGKIVMSTIGSTGVGTDVLVVRKSVVQSPLDLKHVRLGFSSHSLEHVIFALIFDHYGIKAEYLQVNRKEIITEARRDYQSLLINGEIDAAILCEPAITELFSSSPKGLFSIMKTEIDQSLLHQVCFIRADSVVRKQDAILSYMRFVLESNAMILQFEREALSLLQRRLRNSGQPSSFVKTDDVPYYLFENIIYYDLEENVRLYLESELQQKLVTLCKIAFDFGILTERISYEIIQEIIDTSFIEKLARENGLID